MELDDLRRKWQQAAPVPAADQPLRMPAPQRNRIATMYRNAQWELALTVATAFGLPVFIALNPNPLYRLWGACMLLITGVLLFYYRQQLGLLRRMMHYESSIQHHLHALCEGLRKLLTFYYQLTLATGPTLLLLFAGYQVGRELALPGPFHYGWLSAVLVGTVCFGAVLQAIMVPFTRWYLQQLYGRHLDQVEASLRELEEQP